ncbi:PucR family transcriptional regulator [Salibacterium halotolerans]|uniref:Purine catabolism regulatory protein n=1 Tax=Salibacterium halotolerans TaxID=1884432 RepID=A0A1I5QCR6_9BACI|nr:PucR family transcriptional regulator [Salibacterium halotolerans]SFP43907.1 purine catabolism regulatory protein [Salibacterium halotolerans]
MFTVKEMLELPVLKKAETKAETPSALGNPVEWVSIIELPVEDFVRTNEVVLTAAFGCENDEKKLLSFAEEVMNSKAAALIIATGRYLMEIPSVVIEHCQSQGFPLIELPWEIRFADVSHAISTALHHQEQSFVEHSDKIRRELLEIILNGEGTSEIAAYLFRRLKMPVLITDRRGGLKAKTSESKKLEESWSSHLLQHGDPLFFQMEEAFDTGPLPNKMHWVHMDQNKVLQLTVQGAREIQGFIVIEWPEQLPEEDIYEENILILLEHAVTTSALCFLHDQAALETEMRLKNDFVWSLAEGTFESRDVALSRAKSLGYHLNVPYLCIIARPEELEKLYEEEQPSVSSYENWVRQLGDWLEEEVYHTGRMLQAKTMTTFQKEDLIIFIETHTDKGVETAYPFIELLEYRVRQVHPSLMMSWGIAKTFGDDFFHEGYKEASSALDIGRRQKGAGFVTTYANTRFDRALLALTENEELRSITEGIIAPLLHYSHDRGIDLVHTLVIFNRNKGNISQTARDLNLHRQSLTYRLRKIERMTGCGLDDSDDWFLIDLSIRLYNISAASEKKPVE